MALSRPNLSDEVFDRYWIENIILKLGDKYHIRIYWDKTTAVLTGTFAVAGALVGGYAGSRLGAVVGAGVGGLAGLTLASLREVWSMIRDKMEELIYIVFNYLRRFDTEDYINAFHIIMACAKSRQELIITIVEFLIEKLGKNVISSLTSA